MEWRKKEIKARRKKKKEEERKKERKNIHYIVDSQHFLSCDINRLFELCVQTDLILWKIFDSEIEKVGWLYSTYFILFS